MRCRVFDELADLDLDDLRPVIIDVAERVLTQRQLEVFVLHFFAGQSVGEVAHALTITKQVVSETINGREGRTPGILKRMGDALKKDTAFQETVKRLKDPPPEKKAKGQDVVGWYKGARPLDFVPLAVLHYANALADKDRRLSVGMLQQHIPPVVVSQALPHLRITGFIRTDGIDIVILKTPTVTQEIGQ